MELPQILDIAVLFFFGVFVVLVALMQSPIMNLLRQSEKTLDATENLIRTLDKELGPTLNEVHSVIGSVHEFRSIAEKKIEDVGTRVDDVSGSITKAAGHAKTETSVWGTGLFAGIRAYLSGNSTKESAPSAQDKELSGSGAKN